MSDLIFNLPKIELHRHIEGSVRTRTMIEIARKNQIPLPSYDLETLDKMVRLFEPMNSLAEVLKIFELAQSIFVSLAAIEQIVYEMLESAYYQENIKLLEIRYSPSFMLYQKDLDWQKALEVIHQTILKFEAAHCGDFFGGIIVIYSRCYDLDTARKTIDFAIQNRERIVGFDFADDEIHHPSSLYRDLAQRLHEARIPITVHSGEEGSFQQILETIDCLKPHRIGHGVKAVTDPTGFTLKRIIDQDITIETNPISNYLTQAVDKLENHPLPLFIRQKVKVSISADDPELLNTNLNKEYTAAQEKMGLTVDDLKYTNQCALWASFLPAEKKEQVKRLFDGFF